MILVTLVTGASAGVREAAIAAALEPGKTAALILEGLPDASVMLAALAESSIVQIARIAPGCPCCSGNLTLRVTLNRMLRQQPERLYIGLSSSSHLDHIRAFLSQPPYGELLTLTPDLQA